MRSAKMKVQMNGTKEIVLIAETLEDGTLLERLRSKFEPSQPDPVWPQGIPYGGMSGEELTRWFLAQEKAGRNPLLLDCPIQV